jgi:tetratricopeptide (TPR) repeat protein
MASIGPIALVGSVFWQGVSFVGKRSLGVYPPRFPLCSFPACLFFAGLVLFGLGILTWRQAHLYTDAETIWSDTLQRNPASGLAYNNLATEFSRRKEYSRALPYFEKALALSPNEPFAHSNLSITHFYMGDFTRALEHGFQAVTLGPLTPQSALYADRLGQILWYKGDLVQAGHYWHDAEQRKFANSDIYYHLGILTLLEVPLLELGGPQEGVARLEKSLQLDSKKAVAAHTLAWALATFPDPAIRDGQRAVTLAEQVCARGNYRDVEAIDTLGAAYAAAGRFTEAVRVVQIAVNVAIAQRRLEFARRVQARLDLYRSGEPYIDTVKEKLTL